MHEFLRWRFQLEISRQCRFGLHTLDELGLPEPEDGPEFWGNMQAFLGAAANVSKLLWGTREQIARDREGLRIDLGIDDSSVLRDRNLRNHFEHFDERLQTWWEDWEASGHQEGISDTYIGDIDDINHGALSLRNFDTKTCTVHFRGERHEILPIAKELERLDEKAFWRFEPS